METLQSFDATLFYWINSGWSNPVFDVLFPLFRNRFFWAPLYVFVVAFVLENFGCRKGWVVLAGMLVVVALSDFTSSTLIKKNVQRLRPCNDVRIAETVIERVPCGSGYSFTSSHASNHFALAVYLAAVLSAFTPLARVAWLSWATLVAVAQVYVGVHYPFDVAAGGLLGAVLGWGVFRLFKKWNWLK